jgi:hypothetical protein
MRVQTLEYRYQKAQAAKAQWAEELMSRQDAELARVNAREAPEDQKAVMRLAARDNLYSKSVRERTEERMIGLDEALEDLSNARGYLTPAKPKGKGIGAFFGRLFNGRATEAQRRRQGENINIYYNGGGGFELNHAEEDALKAYRASVAADRPLRKEAQEIAEAMDGQRPQRYRAISPSALEVEGQGLSEDDKKAQMTSIFTSGGNMVPVDENNFKVVSNRIIEGSKGADSTERDATYRLGWASFAVFEKRDGLFEGRIAAKMPVNPQLDADGKVRMEEVEPFDFEGKKFGQVSTAAVSGCSVVIVKKGDTYAMLHLDAKHTQDGDAKTYLLDQIKTTFGAPPGDIEIMESVRNTQDEATPSGGMAPPSEVTFCQELEAALTAGGNTLKVQRIDRNLGQTKEDGYDLEHLDSSQPSGHLEIGITSQDVVYGDRVTHEKTSSGIPGNIRVAPVEWRLGASQETAEAAWKGAVRHFRPFASMEGGQKHADEQAETRVKDAARAETGRIHMDRHSPETQEAMRAAARVERRPAGSQREQAQAQAQAVAPQQAQAQATAPRREHISRDTLDAAVRPHTPAAPTGRRRADSMRAPAATPPEHAQHQRGRSAGN